jgi:hypothetical protein
MPPADSHSFRYEHDLCSLPEGQTLADWRRTDPRAPDGTTDEGKRRRARRPRADQRRGGAEALPDR